MKSIQLNDGNILPAIGFGTYKAKEQEGIAAIKNALQKGYRLLDSAAKYENEEAVGKGIKASNIPREEIIVTTKVWRENLGYDNAKKAVAESLEKLQLDYIDLFLIHWPANARNFDNWQEVNAETWRALEELQTEGKLRSIGVSNFWLEHLEALLKTAKVKPAVNQIEFHPGYWQPEVTRFCEENDIVLEAWSPLARGRVFENELLNSLAKKYNKSVSQVCLRWVSQHGVIPVPKSTTLSRIVENIDIFDFALLEEEMEQIDNLPQMGFSGELPNIWPERLKVG